MIFGNMECVSKETMSIAPMMVFPVTAEGSMQKQPAAVPAWHQQKSRCAALLTRACLYILVVFESMMTTFAKN